MILNQTNNLEDSILKTIIYFDIFDFPLTAFEIWKNLYSNELYSFESIIKELNSSVVLKNKLSFKESFYFLKNREHIILKRKMNYILSYNKYKKGMRFIKIISNFSCFKSVFISNNLAIDNSKNESDIDLYIVSRKNKIWTARFVSVVIAELLGIRPKENNKKDKICLSMFSDEKDLSLEKVCKNKDPLFIYWINQIVPVFDPKNVYKKFIKENSWTKEHIKNIFEFNTGYKRKVENNLSKKIFRKLTNIINSTFIENILKKIQFRIFPDNIKNKIISKNSEDVFIDEVTIKLHDNNNREIYNSLFLERTK